MERLKIETRIFHERLETDLNLLDQQFLLENYRGLLDRFLGYYEPWEKRVDLLDSSLLEGRSKVARLRADLHYLGAFKCPTIICGSLPVLDTHARILGSMYVIEGATLGGQILSRHFSSTFGFNGSGCQFFGGYGERTGHMWTRFGAAVNALPAENFEAAVLSAVATFQSMHAWLCPSA